MSIRLAPLGLKVKMTLFVVGLILIIMSSISFLFGLRYEQTLRSETRKRATKIAQTAGSMSLLSIPGAAPGELSRNFIPLIPQLDPNVLYAVMIDEAGRVQAMAVNRPLLKALLPGKEIDSAEKELIASISPPTQKEGNPILSRLGALLPVEVPLRLQREEKGKIAIGFSLEAMRGEIFYARMTAVGLTLGFLLLGIVVAFGMASSITGPIQVLVEGMEAVRKGELTREVQIPNKDEIGALAGAFNFMLAGLRERERIKGTFKRYVSKQVAEKLLEEREILVSGERRRASILFSDIRGFTPMSERMSPEEVVNMLNEYFGVMIDIIFAHEGTLDKFIGDAIMAVFGAPARHKDDPLRAVKTAIAMQRALVELNEERDRRGAEAIYIGIGISTGDVVAGNIGSEKRMEYAVIGDYVNLAARIQAKSGKQKIYICPETYRAVNEIFQTIPLEPMMLKGKSHSVQIYEVLY